MDVILDAKADYFRRYDESTVYVEVSELIAHQPQLAEFTAEQYDETD